MQAAPPGKAGACRLGGMCLAMLLSAVLVVGCGGGGGGSFTLPSNATLPTGAGGGGGGGGGQTTTETVSPPPVTQKGQQDGSTNWALIALIAGAVVLVALIGWLIARRRGARGRYSGAVNDICDEGVTVHDRLATPGQQPGAAIARV